MADIIEVARLKSRVPIVRRRIQRAFLVWYSAHMEQYPVLLHYVRRNDKLLELGIAGLHPAISISLTCEIVVSVDWQQEQCWDLLRCFEALPEKQIEGYTCGFCKPEYRVVYSSREACWQDHLFEPFMQWVSSDLLPAKWLGLFGNIENGCTWAKLLTDPDPKATELLPLWLNH